MAELLSRTSFRHLELSEMHLPGGCLQLQETHTIKVVLTFCTTLKGQQMILILPHLKKQPFFAVSPISAIIHFKGESDPSVRVVLLFAALTLVI